ncbi:unnamed protein product [Effrenium voratum]|nr:unnamed protein product [Effrenium voratum]
MQADDDDNERKNGKVDLPLEAPNFGIATQAVYAGVLSSFLYGYHLCNLNSCMDFIGLHFQWCKSHTRIDCLASAIDGGLINAILYLGAAAGALLVGRPFMVNYGSRVQLVISAISAPVFIAEVSPAECRGWHAAKHGLYIAVGLLAAELVGLPQDPPDQGLTERNGWWWRAILGLPLLLAGFQFVIFKYDLPVDSVSFLVRQGRMDEARIMLYKTYGLPPPQLEPGLGDHVAKLELKLKDLAVVAAEAGITRRITILQALTDPYLRCSVVVGFFLASYQQLTGINAWHPGLFVVSWNYGLGAITWLWLSEIYPMEIRGPALSACGVIKWLSCFFIVLIARFLRLGIFWEDYKRGPKTLLSSPSCRSACTARALPRGAAPYSSARWGLAEAGKACLPLVAGVAAFCRTQSRRLVLSVRARQVRQESEQERRRLDQEAREGMEEYMRRIEELAGEGNIRAQKTAWKWDLRKQVWNYLEDNGLADFPRPVHHRIPNFQGSSKAGERLAELPEFTEAKVVKVNPDTPQKSVRLATLRSEKTLYVPQPRLRTGFFSRIKPGAVVPEKHSFAATAGGMKQLAEPMDLEDRTKIDVVVIGSSAVNPVTGARVGKGEGFAELEYGIMRQLGMIEEDTPVITTVHDSQVIKDNFPPKGKGLMKHDVPVDIIVTPTQTIYVDKAKQPPKPKGIYWDLLSRQKLAEIRVLQDLKARIERKTGIELELAEQEEALPPLAKRGKPRRKQPSRPRAESPESEGKAVKSRLRRP